MADTTLKRMSVMVPVVIGLDLGTTACKAIALDAEGLVVASAQRQYALATPQPGWAVTAFPF